MHTFLWGWHVEVVSLGHNIYTHSLLQCNFTFLQNGCTSCIASLLSNLLVIVFIWFQLLRSDRYEVVSCFNLYFPDCTDVEYMFMCFDQLELLGELPVVLILLTVQFWDSLCVCIHAMFFCCWFCYIHLSMLQVFSLYLWTF